MVNLRELELKVKQAKKRLTAKSRSNALINTAKPTKILADIISGVAVGAILGYFVDLNLATVPLFIFLFIIVGAVVGVYLVHKDMHTSEKPDKNNNNV